MIKDRLIFGELKNNSLLAIYKPIGVTSHDVIDQIRAITGIRKVGHAGTLDPLANGVLVVGIGREATVKLTEVVGQEKEYKAVVKFGQTSITDDEEGEKTNWTVKRIPKLKDIKICLKQFEGKIKQVPPQYSAIKKGGRVAYKEARKGHRLNLEARKVEIKKIKLDKYSWPLLELTVTTGKGVYIRSLARDIGNILNVGGYILKLTRTRIGKYEIKNAIVLPSLESCE